jgi:hypothetical protein
LDTRHRKIDTSTIEHKTQKDRHVYHWTQNTERDTGIIGLKTQKVRHR